jgi:glutamine synthetase
MDKVTILEQTKQQGVSFVNLQFTDLAGAVKAVTIPVTKLEEAIDNGIWFDGSSIEGFSRIAESDMYLIPDLKTFAILPWTREERSATTARLTCDVYLPDGTPFPGDPRGILKRQLKRADEFGFTFNTGPEMEFFLLTRSDGKLDVLPHDRAGYFDLTSDKAAEVRKEMTTALQDLHVDVEALHHEVACGQHEIDFRYADALTTADNATTLRYAVKTIAIRNGLIATFMPKPFVGINGSGMHVHQSLFRDGENAFYNNTGPYKLSKVAQQFIAGQLHHVRSFAAITNPLVNSYKRLLPGYEAPVYIAWGQINRSALIRIPSFTQGRIKSLRAELRCPDPSCNIYLAFAVMLAAGLDGIDKGMDPPDPVDENIYELSPEEVENYNITRLPGSLLEALNEMERSKLVREVLGEHTFLFYLREKQAEWNEYSAQVSNWERERYVELY